MSFARNRMSASTPVKMYAYDEAKGEVGPVLALPLVARSACMMARAYAAGGSAVLVRFPDGTERLYSPGASSTLWPYKLLCPDCKRYVRHPKAMRACIDCTRKSKSRKTS